MGPKPRKERKKVAQKDKEYVTCTDVKLSSSVTGCFDKRRGNEVSYSIVMASIKTSYSSYEEFCVYSGQVGMGKRPSEEWIEANKYMVINSINSQLPCKEDSIDSIVSTVREDSR